MENNERNSLAQVLSKIEEGHSKLYYDIGKRIHSYIEENLTEMKQYLQQPPLQDDEIVFDESAKHLELLQNYESLQEDFQKLKRTNENQLSKLQKLKEENERLSKKVARSSSKKDLDNNETDASKYSNETNNTTKKPRKSKNTKTLENFTVTDASVKNPPDLWDYDSLDQLNDQIENDITDESELIIQKDE